jgi:hypothetical protein
MNYNAYIQKSLRASLFNSSNVALNPYSIKLSSTNDLAFSHIPSQTSFSDANFTSKYAHATTVAQIPSAFPSSILLTDSGILFCNIYVVLGDPKRRFASRESSVNPPLNDWTRANAVIASSEVPAGADRRRLPCATDAPGPCCCW